MLRSSLLLVAAILLAFASRGEAGGPDYARDVRPILSGHCFQCHGPDDAARQANLRLDLRASATAAAESGKPAIVPGHADRSELVRRVFAHDADEAMPPAAANKPLSESQKKTLREWVEAGAEYKPHWAFVPPRMVAPKSGGVPTSRNRIDDYILDRLNAAGLKPSAEADRYTLIRRLSLDLIGLPPTPEEADRFVHDASPDAYERLVDRLLASPAYGERWARRWLDLARYADTNGYEKDRPRSIWPFRDWVIAAINADMPFDRFTIEQLAGDMLLGGDIADRVATGFHRNTMLNEEGGIDPLEFRFHAMVDRVATTGTVWMGLTTGCAQCHTHKFDPISHRDYYGLMGLLNNAEEIEIDLPDREIAAARAGVERKVAELETKLPDRFPAGRDAFEKKFQEWSAVGTGRARKWTVLHPAEAKANLPLLTILPDRSILASGDQSKADRYDVRYDQLPPVIAALRLDVLPDDSLPKHGPGRVFYEGPFGDFNMCELTAIADGKPVTFSQAGQSFASNSIGAKALIDGSPLTCWSINGGQGSAHSVILVPEKPITNSKALTIAMRFEHYYAAGLGRFRLSATESPPTDVATVHPPAIEELLAIPAASRSAEQRQTLRQHFASTANELAEARKEIATLKSSLPALPTTLVMSERPTSNPRRTHRHKRGEFLQPLEEVAPAIPAILATSTSSTPKNRLEFARWLVSSDHPLTARVTVNRHWQAFFGRGLVATTEDFGYQGAPPSHPELLDWLALDFVRHGWSLKHLHRTIVLSATYRQTSSAAPAAHEQDPENRLLSHAPRTRLEAELIRDTALGAAGVLTAKLGGPSVFPPQPAGVTSEGTYGALTWKVATGPDRYRRGLYTFSKRTAPFAMLQTFDGPSGEACVARREVTNTPLQALTLLNDAYFVEIAEAMAGRAVAAGGKPEEIAADLFRRCLTRPPQTAELAPLLDLYRRALADFQRDPAAAKTLFAEFPPPAGADAANLAAWTLVTRAILNLDEMITKS